MDFSGSLVLRKVIESDLHIIYNIDILTLLAKLFWPRLRQKTREHKLYGRKT